MANAIFTYNIEDTGVVYRIYFVAGLGMPMNRDWHYFGVTSTEMPIPEATYNSYTEHDYVQFPTDFSELGNKGAQELYRLAVIAGLNKEGLD